MRADLFHEYGDIYKQYPEQIDGILRPLLFQQHHKGPGESSLTGTATEKIADGSKGEKTNAITEVTTTRPAEDAIILDLSTGKDDQVYSAGDVDVDMASVEQALKYDDGKDDYHSENPMNYANQDRVQTPLRALIRRAYEKLEGFGYRPVKIMFAKGCCTTVNADNCAVTAMCAFYAEGVKGGELMAVNSAGKLGNAAHGTKEGELVLIKVAWVRLGLRASEG